MKKIINRVAQKNHFELRQNWINIDFEPEYLNLIYEQIPFFRIESYFNYIFRLLYRYDFLKAGKSIGKKELLSRYLETAEKILKEEVSIVLNENIDLFSEYTTSFDWEEHHIYYGKELGLIKKTILDVVNYDKKIKKIIGIQDGENPYNSEKSHQFVQNLMIIGYSLATDRITSEINNDCFIGIEIADFNDNSELLLYLTPEGMMKAPEYYSNLSKEETKVEFNNNINQLGIQKIEISEMMKKYKTDALLIFENKLYRHYKCFNLSSNEFFNNRINKPHISSILFESQANYRCVNL